MATRFALPAGLLAALVGCLLTPMSSGPPITGVMGVSAGFLALGLITALGWEGRRHALLVQGIARLSRPGWIAGYGVTLVPGVAAAFVGGLRAPRIYWGEELAGLLDDDEVRAVLLHERHHQSTHAPLRLIAVSALARWLRRLQPGRTWIERERARIEIAADAFALASGATRPALASALLKLASSANGATLPGFATAAELRIRALIGESTGLEPDRSASWVPALVGAVVVLACLVGVLL